MVRLVSLPRRPNGEMFVPLEHPPGDAQADFGEAMVVVAGYVSCPTAFYVARGMTVAIPDGLAPSVDIPCTFDLIGGGCASP